MEAVEVVERDGSGGCDVVSSGTVVARFWCVADANIYVMMLVEQGMSGSAYLADGTHIRP